MVERLSESTSPRLNMKSRTVISNCAGGSWPFVKCDDTRAGTPSASDGIGDGDAEVEGSTLAVVRLGVVAAAGLPDEPEQASKAQEISREAVVRTRLRPAPSQTSVRWRGVRNVAFALSARTLGTLPPSHASNNRSAPAFLLSLRARAMALRSTRRRSRSTRLARGGGACPNTHGAALGRAARA